MSKKQSKSNIFLIVLLTILVIAVIGFGGYFIWKLEKGGDKGSQSAVSNNATANNTVNTQLEEKKEESAQKTEKVETKPVETKEDYINSCSTYTYKEIARNPNTYKGKRAKITGEVIQVQQDGNEVVLRVNITKNNGYYEDTIMTGYEYADDNEDRILEGDIITLYGELYGTVTYTSVLGADITVPAVKTKYLEIKK